MNVVSAQELASIQSDAAIATCDQSCQIYRKTLVKDAYGTATEAWALIATVPAGIGEPSGTMLTNYDYLIGSLNAWRVQFPTGTSVMHQDHLVISGQTMTVQVVLEPRSYHALTTVVATEVV